MLFVNVTLLPATLNTFQRLKDVCSNNFEQNFLGASSYTETFYKLKFLIQQTPKSVHFISILDMKGWVWGASEPELKRKLWKIFLKSKNINQKVKKIFLHLQELEVDVKSLIFLLWYIDIGH